MGRTRDTSKIFTTPPNIYATDDEVEQNYLSKTQAQAPFRNLIINGAMQVAQRGTSVTGITGTGYFTVDRWSFEPYTMGTWTMTQENDAPTGSGFRKSSKVLCTTADASPAAGDALIFIHKFEGQNLQAIRKGTVNAQQLTLSFWVKSNVTGTYIAELRDIDNSRVVSSAYTVASSGTWEKKTIVFPADTTGVLDNDNNDSFRIQFWLGAGSELTSGTLNTSWASITNANRVVGQTNLAAATNNYWQITGVQLEVGAVATPFEFKPLDIELMQCMRYYEKSYNFGVAPGTASSDSQYFFSPGAINTGAIVASFPIQFKVPKRNATTTITYYSPVTGAAGFVRNRKNNASTEADKNAGLGFSGYGENMWTTAFGVGIGASEYFAEDTSYVKFHWTASAEL